MAGPSYGRRDYPGCSARQADHAQDQALWRALVPLPSLIRKSSIFCPDFMAAISQRGRSLGLTIDRTTRRNGLAVRNVRALAARTPWGSDAVAVQVGSSPPTRSRSSGDSGILAAPADICGGAARRWGEHRLGPKRPGLD
jgi:hypothetical protein